MYDDAHLPVSVPQIGSQICETIAKKAISIIIIYLLPSIITMHLTMNQHLTMNNENVRFTVQPFRHPLLTHMQTETRLCLDLFRL